LFGTAARYRPTFVILLLPSVQSTCTVYLSTASTQDACVLSIQQSYSELGSVQQNAVSHYVY